MNAASRVTKISLAVFLVVLNVVGWFWLVDRLDLLALRLGTTPPPAMPTMSPTPLAEISVPLLAPLPPHASDPPGAHIGIGGIASPPLRRPEEVAIDDAERVIGVKVDGETRAYVVKAFELRALRRIEDLGVHVVYDSVGGRPICVTHCDRSHSTRVFSSDVGRSESATPLDVRVGGWDDGMVLVVNGARYWQHSPDVPLADVDFVTTTWGKWRAEHPDSLVYLRG